jgi:hypothetical protein
MHSGPLGALRPAVHENNLSSAASTDVIIAEFEMISLELLVRAHAPQIVDCSFDSFDVSVLANDSQG